MQGATNVHVPPDDRAELDGVLAAATARGDAAAEAAADAAQRVRDMSSGLIDASRHHATEEEDVVNPPHQPTRHDETREMAEETSTDHHPNDADYATHPSDPSNHGINSGGENGHHIDAAEEHDSPELGRTDKSEDLDGGIGQHTEPDAHHSANDDTDIDNPAI